MAAAHGEYLVCVDADGRLLEPRLRSECHGNPALTHRVVHVLVTDASGRILAQKRSASKDIQPGKWDTSVGGHLDPGESPLDAARRECREELGIQPESFPPLHNYLWLSDLESEDVTTFLAQSEGPFGCAPDEIDRVAFFDFDTLERMAKSGELTPNFRYELSLYQSSLAGRTPTLLRYPIQSILGCNACPRLARFRSSIQPDRHHAGAAYWNRPVPGFGDPAARLAIVGLAPGAHGANRTGRPFTGDYAGEILYRALHAIDRSNRPSPSHRGDGLALDDVFITNCVKCVPPENKPETREIRRCEAFLALELQTLHRLNTILALGVLSFRSVFRILNPHARVPEFHHGRTVSPGEGLPVVIACYHPSRRNIQTRLVTASEIDRVVAEAARISG